MDSEISKRNNVKKANLKLNVINIVKNLFLINKSDKRIKEANELNK